MSVRNNAPDAPLLGGRPSRLNQVLRAGSLARNAASPTGGALLSKGTGGDPEQMDQAELEERLKQAQMKHARALMAEKAVLEERIKQGQMKLVRALMAEKAALEARLEQAQEELKAQTEAAKEADEALGALQ